MLGLVGLIWSDFATNWQRVAPDVPHRLALARITALYELLTGAAILWRRTAKEGSLLLAALYMVFALLWVPRIIAAPQVYDSWGNFFEEFSITVAGVIAFASLAAGGSSWARRTGTFTRLYAVCVVSFGLDHLFYLHAAASFVPQWIPPGQMFWTVTTAICFLCAAASIFSGILARLATQLLTAMIVGFEVLVWLPKLFATPHDHFIWSANAICLALAAGAWVVADATHKLQSKQESLHTS